MSGQSVGCAFAALWARFSGDPMSRFRNFFSGKPSAPAADNTNDVELDNELYLTIARHLSKENDSIRDLLVDAEQKLTELDTIKRAIAQQVDPVSKTLRALDETKSQLSAAEERGAALDADCARLRETLAATQRKLTAVESTNIEQTKDLSSCRAQIADLKGRVAQQAGDL